MIRLSVAAHQQRRALENEQQSDTAVSRRRLDRLDDRSRRSIHQQRSYPLGLPISNR